jgi:hypothetical protein
VQQHHEYQAERVLSLGNEAIHRVLHGARLLNQLS